MKEHGSILGFTIEGWTSASSAASLAITACSGSRQPPPEVSSALVKKLKDDVLPATVLPQANDSACPQGVDCAGNGGQARIFECEEGCGFQGCADCMEIHCSEPHASDSDNMSELVRGMRRGF